MKQIFNLLLITLRLKKYHIPNVLNWEKPFVAKRLTPPFRGGISRFDENTNEVNHYRY